MVTRGDPWDGSEEKEVELNEQLLREARIAKNSVAKWNARLDSWLLTILMWVTSQLREIQSLAWVSPEAKVKVTTLVPIVAQNKNGQHFHIE